MRYSGRNFLVVRKFGRSPFGDVVLGRENNEDEECLSYRGVENGENEEDFRRKIKKDIPKNKKKRDELP